jgi:hypothetical protein
MEVLDPVPLTPVLAGLECSPAAENVLLHVDVGDDLTVLLAGFEADVLTTVSTVTPLSSGADPLHCTGCDVRQNVHSEGHGHTVIAQLHGGVVTPTVR